MAPRNLGGRPRIAWTPSRQRKLVRLYLMTDLKIKDIQQVLRSDGFSPSTRNIQEQLSLLLPDNVTEWRQYRPSGTHQGKQRLAQLKRCRETQFSKHAKRQAHAKSAAAKAKASTSPYDSSSPYYDPTRHYEEATPFGIPSHSSMPLLDEWYSKRSNDLLTPNDNALDVAVDRSSDKEVVMEAETSGSSSCTTTQGATGDTSLKPISPERPSIDSLTADAMTDADQVVRAMPALRRSDSKVGSIGSASIRTMSSRVSSKLSISLSHVNSVLSASNSWRSSLVYAMSISSGKLSTMSQHMLSREEFRTWNELVDESNFTSGSTFHSDAEAISLYARPCCFFFEKDTQKRTLCKVCGFSEIHQRARSSMSDDLSLIYCASVDRFGNTPLHHAAAAGNTARVVQLMSITKYSISEMHQQNTSRETFLHVIRIEGPIAFAEYLEILRKAASQGFRFDMRDCYGRNISQRLHELMDDWSVDPLQLREAGKILGIEDAPASHVDGAEIANTSPQSPKTSTPLSSNDRSEANEHRKRGPGLGLLKNTLEYARLRRPKRSGSPGDSIGELLGDSDSKLISALNDWPRSPKTRVQLEKLIQESDIHMRDERGHTALAIAARHGLRQAVSLLLEHGANPNTRSYQRTSVMSHAAGHLAQAQKENKERLYARIMSCVVLLSDHGGKDIVTVYDEYSVYTPRFRGKERSTSKPRNEKQIHTVLPIIQESPSELVGESIPRMCGDTGFSVIEETYTSSEQPHGSNLLPIFVVDPLESLSRKGTRYNNPAPLNLAFGDVPTHPEHFARTHHRYSLSSLADYDRNLPIDQQTYGKHLSSSIDASRYDSGATTIRQNRDALKTIHRFSPTSLYEHSSAPTGASKNTGLSACTEYSTSTSLTSNPAYHNYAKRVSAEDYFQPDYDLPSVIVSWPPDAIEQERQDLSLDFERPPFSVAHGISSSATSNLDVEPIANVQSTTQIPEMFRSGYKAGDMVDLAVAAAKPDSLGSSSHGWEMSSGYLTAASKPDHLVHGEPPLSRSMGSARQTQEIWDNSAGRLGLGEKMLERRDSNYMRTLRYPNSAVYEGDENKSSTMKPNYPEKELLVSTSDSSDVIQDLRFQPPTVAPWTPSATFDMPCRYQLDTNMILFSQDFTECIYELDDTSNVVEAVPADQNTESRGVKRRRQYSSNKNGSRSEHVDQRRLGYLSTPLPPYICSTTCGFTPRNDASQGTGRKRHRRHINRSTSSSNDPNMLGHLSMPSIALTYGNVFSFTPETTAQPDWVTQPEPNQALNLPISSSPNRASAPLSYMNENSLICSFVTEEPGTIESPDRNLHDSSSGLSGPTFDETATIDMDENSSYCTPLTDEPRITDGSDKNLCEFSSGLSGLVSDEDAIMDMSLFEFNPGAVPYPEPRILMPWDDPQWTIAPPTASENALPWPSASTALVSLGQAAADTTPVSFPARPHSEPQM